MTNYNDLTNIIMKDNLTKNLVIGITNNIFMIDKLIVLNKKILIIALPGEEILNKYKKYIFDIDIYKELFNHIDSSKSKYRIIGDISDIVIYNFIVELIESLTIEDYYLKKIDINTDKYTYI
jgi:hypothetical protein